MKKPDGDLGYFMLLTLVKPAQQRPCLTDLLVDEREFWRKFEIVGILVGCHYEILGWEGGYASPDDHNKRLQG